MYDNLDVDENDDSGICDPDDEDCEDYEQSAKWRDFVQVCPNCKQQITQDNDSCPFCGDILFRHLQDGVFAPRKGPLSRIISTIILIVIIILVVLAVIGLIWL